MMERWVARVGVGMSAVTGAGLVRSQLLRGHNEPYDFFVVVLQFAVAGTLGILSRTRRAYVHEVEARAEHAEADRARHVALAAAEERARIARELPDVGTPHVTLMPGHLLSPAPLPPR